MLNSEGVEMVRVMLPIDGGFGASGGFGPFRFPYNVLAVLFTPWTWMRRVDEKYFGPRRIQKLEDERRQRGEAPLGYVYKDFPATTTLYDLLETEKLWPDELFKDIRFVWEFSEWKDTLIKDIPESELTKMVSSAQVHWW